jgi:hypothetical protein
MISLDQMREIAAIRGVGLQAERMTWSQLISDNFLAPAFLILTNGNVVSVLQKNCDQDDHIVVSDPLYRDGEPFLLPRDALEGAWEGDALIVNKRSAGLGLKVTWFLAILAGCLWSTEILMQTYVPRETHIQPSLAAPSGVTGLEQNPVSSRPMNDEVSETAPAMEASLNASKADRTKNSSDTTPTPAFAEDLVIPSSTASSLGTVASEELASSPAEPPAPASGGRALPGGELFVLKPRKSSDPQPAPPTSSDRQSNRTLSILSVNPPARPTPPGAPVLEVFSAANAPGRAEAAARKPRIRDWSGIAYPAASLPGSAGLARDWYALTEGSSLEQSSSAVLPCVSTILSAPDAAGVPVRICE